MKKSIIIGAVAAAAITAYLLKRKSAGNKSESPEHAPEKKLYNHMTDVFSRAKAFAGN